jgi:hypothetical protein
VLKHGPNTACGGNAHEWALTKSWSCCKDICVIPHNVVDQVVQELRLFLGPLIKGPKGIDFVASKDRVLAKYQPVFTPEHISSLTEREFREFLDFDNNCHWTGLRRHPSVCSDLPRLRSALSTLLDESRLVGRRLDEVLVGPERVDGLGKALVTAILLVAHPDRYGVWNGTTEKGMKLVGAWPEFKRGEGIGEHYNRINDILIQLRDKLNTDLWILDALWWVVTHR